MHIVEDIILCDNNYGVDAYGMKCTIGNPSEAGKPASTEMHTTRPTRNCSYLSTLASISPSPYDGELVGLPETNPACISIKNLWKSIFHSLRNFNFEHYPR